MELTLTKELLKYALGIASLIIIITFITGFYLGRKRKYRIENIGEAAVRRILTNYCQKSTAHLLNNITLEYGDGTTQIDHILITQNGILVIETKHYSGWLFANEKQKRWTQVIYKVKTRFQNPILQNRMHVRAVQKLLDFIPDEQIQGLVVFTGDAVFKTEIPPGVIKLSKLEYYADNIRLGSLAENMLQYCIGRLEYKRLELTGKTDIEHQQYLERKFGTID
ncbi:MAG: nuclease-related domain-containing protein [Balneolaceae bacterium]